MIFKVHRKSIKVPCFFLTDWPSVLNQGSPPLKKWSSDHKSDVFFQSFSMTFFDYDLLYLFQKVNNYGDFSTEILHGNFTIAGLSSCDRIYDLSLFPLNFMKLTPSTGHKSTFFMLLTETFYDLWLKFSMTCECSHQILLCLIQ